MRFGFGKVAGGAGGFKRSGGPRTFWMQPGSETSIILLDDLPAEVCRHQLYIKGDKTAAGMRQTCAGSDPGEYPNPVPRLCVVCNAMLRNKVIGRKGIIYLSMIEEREFTYKGKQYKDMKLLLEMDPKSGDLWERRKDSYGGLIGARFKVYRSQKQNSSRFGDDWQFVEKVDLVRHFWYSPGVTAIVEAKQRAGERIEHEEAVKLFIARYHYETMLDNYDAVEAQMFVEYAGGGATAPQEGQGGGSYGGASGNVPPPPPAHGQADYSTGQQQTVPTSQAPNVPPPPPARQQQPAPPPDPTPAQQQFSSPGAPQVPPREQQGYQPPPPPPAQQQQQQQQHYVPPAPAVDVPPAPQTTPSPGAAVGGDYKFDAGWSNDDAPF